MNKITFTNDKFKSVKFGFSISYFVLLSYIKIDYFLDNHHRYRNTVRVAYYEHLFILNQAEGPNGYILIAFVLNKVRLI